MPTISRHHVDASLLGCLHRGIDAESLLTRAGINSNPSRSQPAGRVHTHQVGRLFRIIQQELNDEFMGFTQNPSKFELIENNFNIIQTPIRSLHHNRHIHRRSLTFPYWMIVIKQSTNRKICKESFKRTWTT